MNETSGVNGTALIVDDEPDIRELIALSLGRIGLDTHTAANLDEARHLLGSYAFDVCLTDMRLPDGNGFELVRHVQTTYPDLPIAVITAHGNMEAAVEAMKCGAFDFVSKPVDLGRLRAMVMQAVGVDAASNGRTGDGARSSADRSSGGRASVPHTAAPSPDGPEAPSGERCPSPSEGALVGGERLIGRSEPMRELRRLIVKVARTNAPVWITGESGTGKELVARLIHENGPRAGHPFVAINCGAIPAELMESELFGHRKGSFTGAMADSEGLFRRAEGGTIFLDEVASLPLQMQVKLLRAIQERAIRPVGGHEELAVDARVLSASHEDLSDEVEAGRFRHDLYYRLNVISIRTPSLRERPGDIDSLVRAVMLRQESDGGHGNPDISAEAMRALVEYDYPGNVRELENILERVTALSSGASVSAEDLALGGGRRASSTLIERGVSGVGAGSGTPSSEFDSDSTRSDSERERILAVLTETRWNRRRAATILGLTYRQLRYRIERMGLDGAGDMPKR